MHGRNSSGFTLIELLVAMGLGIVLSFGLIQIFQNTRNLANTETSLSRVQEIGRYAMDAIVEEVRMSGFQGCADPNNYDVNAVANSGVGDWKFRTLLGYEVTSSGTMTPALGGADSLRDVQAGTASGNIEARPGSDVIQVTFGRPTGAVLMNSVDGYGSVIFGKDPSNNPSNGNPTCLDKDDLVFVADCSSAIVFRNTNDTCDDDGLPVMDGSGNVTFGLAASENTIDSNFKKLAPGGKGLGFREISFFVADTGRNTPQGNDVFALYRMINGETPEELVEGVEYIQLQYGEDVGGNTRFVAADTVGLDMSNVIAVRIGLLVQGTEASMIEADTNSYVVAGTSIAATGAVTHGGGKFLRKPFMTTIKLRNRR